MSICTRRKALLQLRWLYSPRENSIPEASEFHGVRSGEGNTIILGSSDVVETIRIWRKHTVSPLVAKFNCAPTAVLKLTWTFRSANDLGHNS